MGDEEVIEASWAADLVAGLSAFFYGIDYSVAAFRQELHAMGEHASSSGQGQEVTRTATAVGRATILPAAGSAGREHPSSPAGGAQQQRHEIPFVEQFSLCNCCASRSSHSGKGELEMSKVYRLIEIQLREGVKAEDYEKFMVEEWYPLPPSREGLSYFGLLKGDRGPGEGQYQSVYVYDSVEARDRYDAGQLPEIEQDEQVREARAAAFEKFTSMATWIHTDYIVVGR